MDHKDVEERQVVDRYLMGRLSADEAAIFEEHYLHCQECLDQLETAESMQRGFKRAAAEDAARAVTLARVGILAWVARAVRSPRAGWAVALLLAVTVLPAILVRERHEPRVDSLVVSMNPERSAPLADAEPTHQIRLADASEWLVLSLELDRPEYPGYRVTLSRAGDELWRRDGLEPDPRDSLVLSLHSSWLEAGDYAVRVDGLPLAGEPVPVARFSFRVLAGD